MDVTNAPHLTLLARLADWSYRRRRRVLLLWVVLLIGTSAAAGAFGGSYHFTFATPGSDSQKAQDLLQRGLFTRRINEGLARLKAGESRATERLVRE